MMDRGNSTQGGALLVINEGISDTYSVHVNTKDLTMLKGHSIKKNLYLYCKSDNTLIALTNTVEALIVTMNKRYVICVNVLTTVLYIIVSTATPQHCGVKPIIALHSSSTAVYISSG